MLAACAPFARWIDVFCEQGAFDAEQSRAVLEAGRSAGLGLRVHGNQLGPGPGIGLAVEMGAASVDHCTYFDDADIEALAGGDTVATFLPATDFSTRQPYPDARRMIDAGARVAIATNTNPGSSNTTSMSFCIALAVREMGMTVDEALQAATLGGANALRRDDVGRLAPGARADAVVLDAASYAGPRLPARSAARQRRIRGGQRSLGVLSSGLGRRFESCSGGCEPATGWPPPGTSRGRLQRPMEKRSRRTAGGRRVDSSRERRAWRSSSDRSSRPRLRAG